MPKRKESEKENEEGNRYGENSFESKNRFSSPSALHTMFTTIKDNQGAENRRTKENLIKSFDRQAQKNVRTGKLEVNHGQFTMKVMAACDSFTEFLTQSSDRFQVLLPFDVSPDTTIKENRIAAAFHKYFLKTWPDMFIEEDKMIFDLVMSGKGVHHWPERVGYRSEVVPSGLVYPSLGSSMQPKTWNLAFVQEEMSLNDLYDISFGPGAETNVSKGWNEEGLEAYLTFKKATSRDRSVEGQFNRGNTVATDMEKVITIIHCYVKEYTGKVTKFIIPYDTSFYESGEGKKNGLNVDEYLFCKEEYVDCISHVISVRSNHTSRSYWSCPSFAELIYLSCKFYDQATNAIIRAAIRNMTLFLKSANPDQADKLRKIGASEVEVLDSDTTLEQARIGIPVQEMVQVVRQVMFDAERQTNQSQAPGSQNVKGYAITAEEAKQRALDGDRSESILLKRFTSQDGGYYSTMYRRAVKSPSHEEKKLNEAFAASLNLHGISKDDYDPDNVIILPLFSFGGSRSNKISFAQSLLSAVSVGASTVAQQKAKRELISAHVGAENADQYINDNEEMKNLVDVQDKAGLENEAMDNPVLNPSNVPVSPDDKHSIEVMFHLNDYKFKLSAALKLIQSSANLPPAMKIALLIAGRDLIVAQDNKGAHMEAHFKYWSQDPNANKDLVNNAYGQFDELRKSQDQMQKDAESAIQEYMQSVNTDSELTIKSAHAKQMSEIEVAHAKQMNEIALGKALQQHEEGKTAKQTKVALEVAASQSLKNIKVDKESQLAQIAKEKAANNLQQPKPIA